MKFFFEVGYQSRRFQNEIRLLYLRDELDALTRSGHLNKQLVLQIDLTGRQLHSQRFGKAARMCVARHI